MTAEERKLLQETHDAVIELRAQCPGCRQRVDRNTSILEGNGTGLIYRVGVLEGYAKWLKMQTATVVLFCSALLLAMLKSYMGW